MFLKVSAFMKFGVVHELDNSHIFGASKEIRNFG